MTPPPSVTFDRRRPDELTSVVDALADLYALVYAEPPYLKARHRSPGSDRAARRGGAAGIPPRPGLGRRGTDRSGVRVDHGRRHLVVSGEG
ncbi:hypothetical protein V2I01_23175 [Micromonospora sp. BRA006-A]|nr:hypothetical protein [Micromonospora sp. BRA006-A]